MYCISLEPQMNDFFFLFELCSWKGLHWKEATNMSGTMKYARTRQGEHIFTYSLFAGASLVCFFVFFFNEWNPVACVVGMICCLPFLLKCSFHWSSSLTSFAWADHFIFSLGEYIVSRNLLLPTYRPPHRRSYVFARSSPWRSRPGGLPLGFFVGLTWFVFT